MNKTLSTSLKALHIGVVREGRFIEDRWFKGGVDVTIGTGAKNTFAMPLSTLADHQPLFMHKQGKLMLCFDETARGKLTVIEGKELDLGECRRMGLASPKGGRFEMPVNEEMRGHLTFGEVSFVFNFSKPPPRPPRPVLPREVRGSMWNVTDHTFLSVLLISFTFHGCMIAAVSRRDLPPEDPTFADIPDTILHISIPKPEQPKEQEKPPELVKNDPVERADKQQAPKDSVQHQKEVGDAVRKLGLIRAFDEGGALGDVLKPNDSLDEIARALQDNPSLDAVATSGEHAKPKGSDAGHQVGIGDLGTHDKIASAPRLQEQKDIGPGPVTVTDREIEVDSPALKKDALAAFIKSRLASIRACYETQLKRSPNLRGKIVMQFTITAQGTVSEASAAQDSMGSDEVTGCIVRQIKSWKLPFKPDGDVTVSFPFVFSPAN